MKTKIAVAAGAVLILGASVAWFATNEVRGKTPKYSHEDITDLLARSYSVEAIQPPDDLIELVESSVVEGGENVVRSSFYPVEAMPNQSMDVLIRDHIPYFSYYSQKDEDHYIIHPMRTGRFLVENATGTSAPDIVEAIVSLAMNLPNGGLAWYYPRHYQVARMMGPHLKYSAISQGTLIAGLTAAAESNPEISIEYAERAFQAMFWPFDKGGVNLDGKSVLEMPAFAGPPEIILNGWIDALLHIRDYALEVGDAEAIKLFEDNIAFLVETLPNFDARDQRISRYSDLSPYRVNVTLESADQVDSLRIIYAPRVEGLEPILVDLERTEDPEDFSIYENQIFRQNGASAFVWLSCTQLYDTILLAESPTMQIAMNSGEVNRTATAPGVRGEPFEVAVVEGDISFAVIDPDGGLTCGYPTNFSKGGVENFYHAYHVVSLMVLALGEHITQEQQQVMIEWALLWLDDMEHIKETEGREFRDPQLMLNAINGGKISPSYRQFDELLSEARSLMSSQDG